MDRDWQAKASSTATSVPRRSFSMPSRMLENTDASAISESSVPAAGRSTPRSTIAGAKCCCIARTLAKRTIPRASAANCGVRKVIRAGTPGRWVCVVPVSGGSACAPYGRTPTSAGDDRMRKRPGSTTSNTSSPAIKRKPDCHPPADTSAGNTRPALIPPSPETANTPPITVPRLDSNHVLTSIDPAMVVARPKERPATKPNTYRVATFVTNATPPTAAAIHKPPATTAARTPIFRNRTGARKVIAKTPDTPIRELKIITSLRPTPRVRASGGLRMDGLRKTNWAAVIMLAAPATTTQWRVCRC